MKITKAELLTEATRVFGERAFVVLDESGVSYYRCVVMFRAVARSRGELQVTGRSRMDARRAMRDLLSRLAPILPERETAPEGAADSSLAKVIALRAPPSPS